MPNFGKYSWSSASLTWTNVVHVNFVWNKEIAVVRANPFTRESKYKTSISTESGIHEHQSLSLTLAGISKWCI